MRGEDQRSRAHHFTASGSPPHARGRRGCCAQRSRSGRITPACAGKTSRRPGGRRSATDHPRMRGEDKGRMNKMREGLGSPPHARGRRVGSGYVRVKNRITPACAGKTAFLRLPEPVAADHPRMRGEDGFGPSKGVWRSGSPPHARGRPRNGKRRRLGGRITPACAGKTGRAQGVGHGDRDHPRMRGEDSPTKKLSSTPKGSPPHARGRPRRYSDGLKAERITPACAGKTAKIFRRLKSRKDHPRMRGEDAERRLLLECQRGSPPHARGRHLPRGCQVRRVWITPACAGKTSDWKSATDMAKDHPRMRGEDVDCRFFVGGE